MMAVRVESGSTFSASSPRLLFEAQYVLEALRAQYDVMPDGRSFVLIRPEEPTPSQRQLRMVVNWGEELRRVIAPAPATSLP